MPLTTTVAQATAREDLNEAKRLAPYVNTILSGLKVDPVKEARGYYKETRLIDIKFTHPVPDVTSKVVNAIAETYVFSNLEKRTEANSTTGDFLQKRIAELQQQIRTSEERLVNYAKNNQIISLDPNQNTVVERLAGLNQQLLAGRKRSQDCRSRLQRRQTSRRRQCISGRRRQIKQRPRSETDRASPKARPVDG